MRFLITAGPTREAIDPVRYLSNRSSGKMGYAIAAAVAAAGHEARLISGPVSLKVPGGVICQRVQSAQEMYDAVAEEIGSADVCIMAAAVADYRPVAAAAQKIKKAAASWTLTLERTPDILGSARAVFGFAGVLVGFAAETENLVPHALEKLRKKRCDLILANDVSRGDIGFDGDDNAVTLVFADGSTQVWEKMTKTEMAEKLVGVCLTMVEGSTS